jgi:hypothetical protein
MGVTVKLVSTPEERRSLFELRHRIYVEEMRGAFPAAVRRSGQLHEDVDEVALNYGLFDGAHVVGSLRVVDLHRIDPATILDRYGVREIVTEVGPAAVCFAGRLALEGAYRSRGHMVRLVGCAYADARARGVRFAVSDCSLEMLPLYRRLGYRVQAAAFEDPLFGPKIPIVWPLEYSPPTLTANRQKVAQVDADRRDGGPLERSFAFA